MYIAWLELSAQDKDMKYQQLLNEASQAQRGWLVTAHDAALTQRFFLWLGHVLVSTGKDIRRLGQPHQVQAHSIVTLSKSSMGVF